ncbi:MAG: hypothetical protein WEB00_03665 [Dehalococcoidia bacterium]
MDSTSFAVERNGTIHDLSRRSDACGFAHESIVLTYHSRDEILADMLFARMRPCVYCAEAETFNLNLSGQRIEGEALAG